MKREIENEIMRHTQGLVEESPPFLFSSVGTCFTDYSSPLTHRCWTDVGRPWSTIIWVIFCSRHLQILKDFYRNFTKYFQDLEFTKIDVTLNLICLISLTNGYNSHEQLPLCISWYCTHLYALIFLLHSLITLYNGWVL